MAADASGPGHDSFTRAVEDALELCQDPVALEGTSPLAAPYFLGRALPASANRPGDRGRTLASLLARAHAQLNAEARALLDAAFFKRDSRQQHSGIALSLHLSERTYFRHKAEAVRALAAALVTSVLPPLRGDTPIGTDLFGRVQEHAAIAHALKRGETVFVSGAGGIGKTSLASAVAQTWLPQRVFWHTVHIGLSDSLNNLLFALAYFLRDNGALATWRQIVADKGAGDLERAAGALRFDLAELQDKGVSVLLCIDEADLLRPELQSHAPVLEFLGGLRGKTALLLLGQRQAVDADLHVQLGALSNGDCSAWLNAIAPELSRADQMRIAELSRGNPAYLKLLLALRALSAEHGDDTRMLAGAPSMELLFGRIWRRMHVPEKALAVQIALCRGSTPREAWHSEQAALERLLAHGIIQADGAGSIRCAPFARELIVRQTPQELRAELHMRAAELRAGLGEYSEAAYHWLAAGQASIAVWLLYAQRTVEVERGNGPALLALLASVDARDLQDKRERDVLHALRAQLGQLFGDVIQAEADARAVSSQRAELVAYASEALGESLTRQDRIDQALAAYRNGLDALLGSPQYRSVRLRNKAAYLLEARLHRIDDARNEALGARLEAEIMAGGVEDRAGNYAAARAHFEAALVLAQDIDTHLVERALLYASYGNLLWKVRELDQARHWLREALRLDQQRGDLQAQASQHVNLSAVNIMAARYDDALAEARAGLAIAEPLQQSYLIAGLCSNAGEACCHLRRYDDALAFAHRSLSQEDEGWRPYALTVAGMAEAGQGNAALARRSVQSAVAAAADIDDAYAEAAALRVLGDIEHRQRAFDSARTAYARSLALYERLNLTIEHAEVSGLLQVLPPS